MAIERVEIESPSKIRIGGINLHISSVQLLTLDKWGYS
jgi:hypothetical protein